MRRDQIQKGMMLTGGTFRARVEDSDSDDVVVKTHAAAELHEIARRVDAAVRMLGEIKKAARR